eukprot:2196-Eustigmatos_ZCMA.PRE.1
MPIPAEATASSLIDASTVCNCHQAANPTPHYSNTGIPHTCLYGAHVHLSLPSASPPSSLAVERQGQRAQSCRTSQAPTGPTS